MISDTVQIEGNTFVYILVIQPAPTNNTSFDTLKEKFIQHPSESKAPSNSIRPVEFNALINTNKLWIIESYDKSLVLDKKNYDSDMINIRFASKEALIAFVKRMKKYENVFGYLADIEVGDATYHEERQIQKLIQKGKIRTQKTAKCIGKEIGDILTIIEETFDENTNSSKSRFNQTFGWTAFPPIYANQYIYGI